MILTRYILTNLVPQHFDSYVFCMPSCYFLTAWCTLGLKNGRNFFPEFLRKPTLFHSKWKKPLYVWDYCVQGGGSWKAKKCQWFEECAHLRIPCMAQEMHKITGYNFVAILPPLPPLLSFSLFLFFPPLLPLSSSPLPSPFSPLLLCKKEWKKKRIDSCIQYFTPTLPT